MSNLISELTLEILQLRDTITYCQNQIVRKEIALMEILQREGEAEAAPAPQKKPDPRIGVKRDLNRVTVRSMVESVLPTLNGSIFDFRDLTKLCVEKYPAEVRAKIVTGVHPAVKQLCLRGTIERVPGGFQNKTCHA